MKPLLINFEVENQNTVTIIGSVCEELTENTKIDKVRLLKKDSVKSPATRITKVNAETIDDD